MSDLNNDNIIKQDEQKVKDPLGKRLVASILEYVEMFVFSLAVVVCLFVCVFRLCEVSGDSMNNTLKNKENLIVTNLFYEPKHGDIVVFHQTGIMNEAIVKRVIAVEGETVDIDYSTMKITVTDVDGNVRVVDEPYVFLDEETKRSYFSHPSDFSFPRKVPEGSIFVLGDNRYNSLDSRYSAIGFVDVRRVIGKVVFRVFPFSEFGIIN